MVHQVDAIIGIVEALGLGWVGLDLKFVWVTDSEHKWDPLPPAGTLLEKGHGTHSKDTRDKYNDNDAAPSPRSTRKKLPAVK